MFAMMLAAFVIGVAVAVPPGPVVISGSQKAVTGGFWSAFNFYMGSITADAFYALLVTIGLSALIERNPAIRIVLWLLGGAWLCYMGLEAIRTRVDGHSFAGEAVRSTRWRTYRAGLLITLFNPLTIVAWVALAGNFFTLWRPEWPPVTSAGWIAIVAMLAGVLGWLLSLALAFSVVRHRVNARLLNSVSVVSGVFLILYGLSAWYSALDALI